MFSSSATPFKVIRGKRCFTLFYVAFVVRRGLKMVSFKALLFSNVIKSGVMKMPLLHKIECLVRQPKGQSEL